MTVPKAVELGTGGRWIKTYRELLDNKLGRNCVCGSFSGYYQGKKDVWWCHNKRCPWHNMCTQEHSVEYTELDQLYKLVFDSAKGFCECEIPKLHEPVPQYTLCVNDGCFKVLREYEKLIFPDER